MNDSVRTIFHNAVLQEEAAYRMYKEFASKAKTDVLKKLFTQLAEEELGHKSILKNADIDFLKGLNDSELGELTLLQDVDKTDLKIEDFADINNALDLAIKEEEKAYHDYSIIIRHIEFSKFREAMEAVAQQELRHKQLLQKAKLELDDNAWNVLG